MPYLNDWVVQVFQVGTVLGLGPLVTGVIARLEAIVQMRRGPRLLQPYYDIAKLFRKETVLPEGAGPVFRAAPYVSFAAYLTVPLLIPVLTTFPLPLGYMGDILGGGLILGMASFAVSLAAIDSGSPYAQLGSSRLRSFGALAEPTVLFVIFTVALITQTDLPYAMVATLQSTVALVQPAHLLALAAFFMVVLAETGRVPLENHGATLEFGMIEEARVLEHSGPGFALLRWGSSMKQLILYVIFANVLVVPWGLASDARLDHVLEAVGWTGVKCLAVGLVVVAIETSFAKLRLYKIPEFTVASFLLAVLAVISFVFERELGPRTLTVFDGFASVVAVAVLLLAFFMLRSQELREQLRLYGGGSVLVAVLAFAAAAATRHGSDLYALGAVTIAFKALAIPLGLGYVVRNLEVPTDVPSTVRVPTSFLIGIALAAFSFLAVSRVGLHASSSLPLSALAVAVAVVLVAFQLMIVRPYAPSQILGFLVLENGVTLASLVIAPSLPLILALLLLFDLFVGVIVFVLLVQYFGLQRTAVTTDVLDRLRG